MGSDGRRWSKPTLCCSLQRKGPAGPQGQRGCWGGIVACHGQDWRKHEDAGTMTEPSLCELRISQELQSRNASHVPARGTLACGLVWASFFSFRWSSPLLVLSVNRPCSIQAPLCPSALLLLWPSALPSSFIPKLLKAFSPLFYISSPAPGYIAKCMPCDLAAGSAACCMWSVRATLNTAPFKHNSPKCELGTLEEGSSLAASQKSVLTEGD